MKPFKKYKSMKKYVDFSPVKENGKKVRRIHQLFAFKFLTKDDKIFFMKLSTLLEKVDLRKSRL